uniref:Laminin IV type A domain-containing protein n=1 Tax=Trichogramma kaykai TaxID=54128 RepID=A0ABD2W9A4_9HYME
MRDAKLLIESVIESSSYSIKLPEKYPKATGNLKLHTSSQKRSFWILPEEFRGNMLSSYGGDLGITQIIKVDSTSACYRDQDIVINGNGISLFWINPINYTYGIPMTYEVPLTESHWRSVSLNGFPSITRFDFMTVLANVESILVRATYCNDAKSSTLLNLTIEVSTNVISNKKSKKIEICKCPLGYSGMSCEHCEVGYYRNIYDNSKNALGTCIKCPCLGYRNGCYINTFGIVTCNCLQNFSGLYCQLLVKSTQVSSRINSDRSYFPTIVESTMVL